MPEISGDVEQRIYEVRLTDFVLWMGSLTKHDLMNFEQLMCMPTARDILEKCPRPDLKKWGTFYLDEVLPSAAKKLKAIENREGTPLTDANRKERVREFLLPVEKMAKILKAKGKGKQQ